MPKRTLAVILSLIMAVSMMPMFAFASEIPSEPATETTEATEPTEPATEAAESATDIVESAGEIEEPMNVTEEEKEEAGPTVRTVPAVQLQKSTSAYAKKMRIYALYLYRSNGSKVTSDRFGDAVLIESNGKYLLMDTGSSQPIKGSKAVVKSSIVSILKKMGVKELDIYISHLHSDHTGGLEDICHASGIKVNNVFLPDLGTCEKYYTPGGDTIQERYAVNLERIGNANVVFLKPSFRAHKDIVYNGITYAKGATVTDNFCVGGVSFKVIGPVGTYAPSQFASQHNKCGTMEGHCLNNCSLTTMVQCGNVKYLTCGDAEKQEEAALVKKYGNGLNSDIMKLSHHSLYTSNTSSFLSRITPTWSFEENHGYSGSSVDASIKTASGHGFNLAIASNKKSMMIDVQNNRVRIYKDSNLNYRIDEVPVRGWVKCGTHYQYYDGAGYIHKGWNWLGGYLYYMNGNSGFRYTGTCNINGTKVKFNSYGRLTSHKKPAKVSARSAKAKSGHKIQIKWRKAARTSRYQIYRSTSKNGTYVYVNTVSSKARTYTNGGLTAGRYYYYKVRAIRYVAGGTMYGSFSKVKSAKAK